MGVMDRPLCKCHGEPMVMPSGWRCAIKQRERTMAWYWANTERHAAIGRAWAKANPERRREQIRESARRRYGWYDEGGMANQPTKARAL